MCGKQPVTPLTTAQLTSAEDDNHQDKYRGVQHQASNETGHGPNQAEEDYEDIIDLEERHGLDLGNLEYRWILRQVHGRSYGRGTDEEAIRG